MESISGNRLTYLDNVRTVMTLLVVVVHSAITFGSEGGWYFQEATDNLLVVVPLTLISAVSQSFFMSLLFFVSAFFTPKSFDRKGAARFVVDRAKRLGTPFLAFFLGLGPLTILLSDRFLDRVEFSYRQSIHAGPLWFVQALMIFTGVYVVVRLVSPKMNKTGHSNSAPGIRFLAWIGVILASLTFLARWVYPIGTGIAGMQIGSFPQYILMFVLGVCAQRRNWLDNLESVRLGRLGAMLGLMILALPVAMFLGSDPDSGFEFFLGGPYWQALFYAVWESVMCIAMSLFFLTFFKRRLNRSSKLSTEASGAAFGIYIMHPPVLIALTIVLANFRSGPMLKFALLASLGIALTFVIASSVRRVPVVNKVI